MLQLLLGLTLFWLHVSHCSILTSIGDPQPTIVPEPLLEELADLRVKYARLLRSYKKEVQKSPEALEEFVETVQTVLDRRTSERIFQSLFDTFVEEEVSIFNTFYLKKFCDIFPEDVR